MTIIVPTDFSKNSEFAALYACELATKRNAGIMLLHCYTTSSVGDSIDDDLTDPILKADLLIAELKDKLVDQFPAVDFYIECSRALIVDKLAEMSNSGMFDLIIMGASGASKAKSVYWGSTTMAVAAKSSIPVVVVPNEEYHFESNHIALLTNFKHEELDTLTEYLRLVDETKSLSLIHVYKASQKRENVLDTLNNWAYNIKEMTQVDQVSSYAEPIQKDDDELDTVSEVVEKLIQDINPDVILVTPSRKTFFERLFTSSVSKAIALEINKPAFFDKI
ncbi:universal stress protein [Sphingobacterium hotanense]|uniref:universal stress protein n=1 Tax=Sphingobacterium hotanense TaxID=649196 RepID=UPI0011F2ECE1|nr:universal stress protein [Sphingobacterium hotanense]